HFRGWTTDGLVRQAAFKSVREDKPAHEVGREAPVAAHRTAATRVAAEAAKVPMKKSKAVAKAAKPAGKSRARKQTQKSAPAAASEVRLTHPDRVYWADAGVTKQDLADYYREVWDWMAPHLINRPLSLVRCPEGTA